MDNFIESFHSSINDSDVDENDGGGEGDEGLADVTVLVFFPLLLADLRRRLLLVMVLLFLLPLELLPLELDGFLLLLMLIFRAVCPRFNASFLLTVEEAAFVLGEVGV